MLLSIVIIIQPIVKYSSPNFNRGLSFTCLHLLLSIIMVPVPLKYLYLKVVTLEPEYYISDSNAHFQDSSPNQDFYCSKVLTYSDFSSKTNVIVRPKFPCTICSWCLLPDAWLRLTPTPWHWVSRQSSNS